MVAELQRWQGKVVGKGHSLGKGTPGDRWLQAGVEEHAELLHACKKGTEVTWERTNRSEGVFNLEQDEALIESLNKNWIPQQMPMFETDHSQIGWVNTHSYKHGPGQTKDKMLFPIIVPNIMTLEWHTRKKLFRVEWARGHIGEFWKDWA